MTTLSLDTLKSLTEAEKNYLDTLDIIDSVITLKVLRNFCIK